ncbi:MAG: hypothetical protein WA274_00375, partial [Candidatus Acidiferrales bacterium]
MTRFIIFLQILESGAAIRFPRPVYIRVAAQQDCWAMFARFLAMRTQADASSGIIGKIAMGAPPGVEG